MKKFNAALLTLMLVACGSNNGPLANQVTVITPPVDTTHGTTGFVPPPGGGFVLRWITQSGIAFPYQIFSPATWSANQKWPIVVSFAGSGERGSDGSKQLDDGLALVVKAQQASFPAVVLFPQAPLTTLHQESQFNAAVLLQIADVIHDYNGDPTRIYLVGFSAGGTIAADFAFQHPTEFAALANISGGMCTNCIDSTGTLSHAQDYAIAANKLKAMPIRMYHGAVNVAIPIAEIHAIAAAFAAMDPFFQYIEYPNTGHAIWNYVFSQKDFFDWIFAQHN